MDNLIFEGIVKEVGNLQELETSGGKRFDKRELLVESEEMYPQEICASLFNERARMEFYKGQKVRLWLKFSTDVYEKTGRVYTNITAWRVDV